MNTGAPAVATRPRTPPVLPAFLMAASSRFSCCFAAASSLAVEIRCKNSCSSW